MPRLLGMTGEDRKLKWGHSIFLMVRLAAWHVRTVLWHDQKRKMFIFSASEFTGAVSTGSDAWTRT
ncbi:MAG: hypothetical protein NTAFB01_07670 [Nitrospira sp.]